MGGDGPIGPAIQLRAAAVRGAATGALVRQSHQGALRALPRPVPLPARDQAASEHRPRLAAASAAQACGTAPLPGATLIQLRGAHRACVFGLSVADGRASAHRLRRWHRAPMGGGHRPLRAHLVAWRRGALRRLLPERGSRLGCGYRRLAAAAVPAQGTPWRAA